MTRPSPALMELMSKVIDGDASLDQLVDQMRVDHLDFPLDDPTTGSDDHVGLGSNESSETEVRPESNLSPDAIIQRVAGATVDLGRQSRCGFGEVIYGEGKSSELIIRIIQAQLDAGQSSLVTRIESGVAFQVRQSFQFAVHNPIAHTLRVSPQQIAPAEPLVIDRSTDPPVNLVHHAAVVSAGSTDARVAEEAIETLAWMGIPFQRFDDLGVAGPQRLIAEVPDLKRASAVVVAAGMEGALPSVVAGHLNCPVFAVPTSVGYGAAFQGLTPLMGMLTSCTANVAVVNIDAGFKGGYMAGLVVDQLQRASARRSTANSPHETVQA